MADMLATPEELGLFMRSTGLDEASATLLLQMATAEVQAAARQRLVLVEDDPFEIQGNTDSWLYLPERPVSDVSSLTIDGGSELAAGTDYKRTRNSASLWRRCGWSSCIYEPSTVAGVYTHGYEVESQDLQLARAATLGLARQAYSNPNGLTSEAIDDYRATWAESVGTAMTPHLEIALRRRYGTRAGLVRIG